MPDRRFALIGHIHTPQDVRLEIAKGNVDGHVPLRKFGRCDNLDSGVATDIWDGANTAQIASSGSLIWVAPTTARKHNLVSSSTDDAAAGSGARTVQVKGLIDWDTAEVTETVTMNGTSDVLTANDYVIIHRMEALTFGASGPNVGEISAVAVTDGTTTAFIVAGKGQTDMAIYGIPSIYTFFMDQFYASFLKGTGAAAVATISLLCATDPENQPGVFIDKHPDGLNKTGTSNHDHSYPVPKDFPGPHILKVQGETDAADSIVTAGFTGSLVLKTLLDQKNF